MASGRSSTGPPPSSPTPHYDLGFTTLMLANPTPRRPGTRARTRPPHRAPNRPTLPPRLHPAQRHPDRPRTTRLGTHCSLRSERSSRSPPGKLTNNSMPAPVTPGSSCAQRSRRSSTPRSPQTCTDSAHRRHREMGDQRSPDRSPIWSTTRAANAVAKRSHRSRASRQRSTVTTRSPLDIDAGIGHVLVVGRQPGMDQRRVRLDVELHSPTALSPTRKACVMPFPTPSTVACAGTVNVS